MVKAPFAMDAGPADSYCRTESGGRVGSERGGMNLSERIRQVLAIDPAAQAVEFEGNWHRWGELAAWLEIGYEHKVYRCGGRPRDD